MHTSHAPRHTRPKPNREATTATAHYHMALNILHTERTLTVARLADVLHTSRDHAERIIQALQADGIVGQPDMYGVYLRAKQEATP